MISRKLITNCLFSNEHILRAQLKSVLKTQARLFNYDHWYKESTEKKKRSKENTRKYLKQLTFEDFVQYPFNYFKKNLKEYVKELKQAVTNTPKTLEHGDFEYLFKFNKKQDLENWKVNTDSGYEVGKTKARFYLTDHNTGHFCGYLSQDLDKPEKMKALYTGYANIQSYTRFWSFHRRKFFNICGYTHFLLKIRGDGRTYVIVLNTPGDFYQTENNVYTTPLYTRGGPHWQYAKIPISKFFHGSHGRISDKQTRVDPISVLNIGFTLMDHNEGPFSLEIDSIALLKDDIAYEEFAYELYEVPRFIANT